MLLLADQWKDYELIDMGNGEKLERWGNYVLRRPDPQVVWPMEAEWSLPHFNQRLWSEIINQPE